MRQLEYEAYDEQVVPRLAQIADEARRRWPSTGRLALLHRTGPLAIGESSVVVAASAPHRAEAFEAARFCIDTLKASVPIWKRETWAGGDEWGLDAQDLSEVPNEREELVDVPQWSTSAQRSLPLAGARPERSARRCCLAQPQAQTPSTPASTNSAPDAAPSLAPVTEGGVA